MTRRQRKLLDYAVALMAVGLALLLRIWLDPLFGESFPFVTFVFAVIFTAWFGGLGPSLVAMVLGYLAAGCFLTPRGYPAIYGVDAQVGAALYTVVGLGSIVLSELMHRARRAATATAGELHQEKIRLESEVRERKEVERSYANLLQRFVRLQEDERRAIAHELHDHTGQDLVAMRLKLQNLKTITKEPDAITTIDEIIALLDRMSVEFRRITFELRPPVLDELGLAATLETYLQQWQRTTNIEADLEIVGFEPGLTSPEIDTTLYRVIKEALNNVAKHSGSARVSVILERRSDGIQVIVEDQGKGFDLEAIRMHSRENSSLGLLGMQERLGSIGGRLDVETAEGRGTTVFARIPLSKSSEWA